MFFDEDRIPAMREMILSKNEAQRRKALMKLLPMQKADFKGIYKAMGSLPVTIRFLDPPLHEFLPKGTTKSASWPPKWASRSTSSKAWWRACTSLTRCWATAAAA
jgi:phosphoenolpyruvate synthase/pyruvate phosphate dikinase